MENKVNPLVDFAFKRIFGVDENKDILVDFLNATLVLRNPIETIEILNPYVDRSALDDKLSILDIKARLKDGELINIEIQIANNYDIEKKSLYYWSKTYVGQIAVGGKYRDLKKTICINILDFDYIDTEYFHNIFHIMEDKVGIRLTDDLEIHFIEMPKFLKSKINIDDKLVEWLVFLKDPDNKNMEEIMEKEPAIKKAMTVLEYISQDKQERMLYEDRQRALIGYRSDLEGAREEGKLEGKLEGKIEGKLEGKLEGITEGITKEKLEVTLKMLNAGLQINQITEFTGLDEIEILKLKGKQ